MKLRSLNRVLQVSACRGVGTPQGALYIQGLVEHIGIYLMVVEYTHLTVVHQRI